MIAVSRRRSIVLPLRAGAMSLAPRAAIERRSPAEAEIINGEDARGHRQAFGPASHRQERGPGAQFRLLRGLAAFAWGVGGGLRR
jgi:hypothetical protein